MRKILLISAGSLVAVGLAVCLVHLGSSHPIVVDNEARASTEPGSLAPLDKVDHSIWDHLLKKYVNDDGMVNYTAWEASAEDTSALKQYLATLGRGDPEAPTTKEGKLAFWINAYNALTVHGILQVYPTSSIRNHTAKLLAQHSRNQNT